MVAKESSRRVTDETQDFRHQAGALLRLGSWLPIRS